ncbi:MAG: hypothetical protein AB7N80_14860 [Bdellovibrionales bacterium]
MSNKNISNRRIFLARSLTVVTALATHKLLDLWPAQFSPQQTDWHIDTETLQDILQRKSSANLAQTLPPHIQRGGRFSVDPAGASLPNGVHLSPEGILTIQTAAPTQMVGVVFNYDEPEVNQLG